MVSKLDPKLESDENYYFFSLLTDRFETLNKLWAQQLENKFGKKFKPIYILPEKHNKLFEEENYIVLNERHEELKKTWKRNRIIYMIYPEDLNRQFSESSLVQDLIKKLVKKQGKVFVLSFTNVWLDIKNPNVVLLGPDSKVAGKFDDKIEHVKTFNKLGLPVNNVEIYSSFEDLKSKRKLYPFFLSATYSSGGIESMSIYTPEDLDAFYANLRPVNRKGSFIAADLIEDIVLSPNTSAIIYGENKTELICIADQILRGNRYMGNVYPSQATDAHKKIMIDSTIKLGNYLSNQGFRGLFGLDFIINKKGDCFVTDLNPRRQGGYFCNIMMSKKINIIELEFKLAIGDPLPQFSYEDFQVDYCWGHSKLAPYFPNMEIIREFEVGHPEEPFNTRNAVYQAIYYPKNHILITGNPGFYITSGTSYNQVKKKIYRETEKTISKSFRLYEGLKKT